MEKLLRYFVVRYSSGHQPLFRTSTEHNRDFAMTLASNKKSI